MLFCDGDAKVVGGESAGCGRARNISQSFIKPKSTAHRPDDGEFRFHELQL